MVTMAACAVRFLHAFLLGVLLGTCQWVAAQSTFPLGGMSGPRRKTLQALKKDIDFESFAVARIFNGVAAPQNRFECMVSLQKPQTRVHYCGGVLITPDLVLTAAHCVDPDFGAPAEAKSAKSNSKSGFSQPNPIAMIGASKVNGDQVAEERQVCKTVIHPKWTSRLLAGWDIALLKLNVPSTKKPCKLYTEGMLMEGQKLTALGWGLTRTGLPVQELQRVDTLQYVPNEKCNDDSKWFGLVKDNMVCADGPNGGDTCDGDSGGPLIMERKKSEKDWEKGDDVVVGITSFGHISGCGVAGFPGVYTSVAAFQDWIFNLGGNNSRVIDVPFCGTVIDSGPAGDKITSHMANNQIDDAAISLAKALNSGDLKAAESAVVKVSDAGLGENAVKAIATAMVESDRESAEEMVCLLAQATKRMPDYSREIKSGGGEDQKLIRAIFKDLAKRNCEEAAEKIAKALKISRAQEVLLAVRMALDAQLDSAVGETLKILAEDMGIDRPDIMTALAPICGGKGEKCCEKLAEVSSSF